MMRPGKLKFRDYGNGLLISATPFNTGLGAFEIVSGGFEC
jgi:hypothetical protein